MYEEKVVSHRAGALVRALARAVKSRRPMDPQPLELDVAGAHTEGKGWLRRPLAMAALFLFGRPNVGRP